MFKFVIVLALAVAMASARQCSGVVSDVKNHRSYKFDLSILHHNDSVYIDSLWYRTDDNEIFYVNFCGQTASACESDDTSVCIRIPEGLDYQYLSGGSTSTQKISIAEAPNQSPSSSVTVTYSHGDKCGSGYYKTKIYVNCQQAADPGYFYDIDQTNKCEPILYMWSAAGCGKEVPYVDPSSSSSAPVSSSSSSSPAPEFCSGKVRDVKNHRAYKFDLSSLHHNDSVYKDSLWFRTDHNVIYYVNFCGQTASACESDDTSVCIRFPHGEDYQYLCGGRTSTQNISIAEDGRSPSSSVTVTYSNGDICNDSTYKTKIYVNCQETANPGFFYDIDETNPCEATLYMYAAAGCGKEVPYDDSSSSPSSSLPVWSSSSLPFCSGIVTDRKIKRSYMFDLSSLYHDDSTYVDKLWYRTDDNRIFYVNFCGQTASPCPSADTSVCMRIPDGPDYQYISGGSTSTQNITIAEDPSQTSSTSVTVTYSDGAKCGDGKYKTKIYVNCQETAKPGYFYDIDETNPCEPILYMWAAAGCGKEIHYMDSSSGFPLSESCSILGSKPLFSLMVIFAFVWMVCFK